MNEAQWLACTDPEVMLEFLRGKTSDHKIRLFAIECCNDARPFLEHRSLAALGAAERYAEGRMKASELANAMSAAYEALQQAEQGSRGGALVVKWLCHKDVELQCGGIARESADFLATRQPRHLIKATRRLTLHKQARLLRDIFGNPFRPVAVESSWLAWNDGTVVKMAQGIYDDGAFDRLPVLADALEDAGCHNTDIHDHCRRPGQHVRGCWVVDLLLGKG